MIIHDNGDALDYSSAYSVAELLLHDKRAVYFERREGQQLQLESQIGGRRAEFPTTHFRFSEFLYAVLPAIRRGTSMFF